MKKFIAAAATAAALTVALGTAASAGPPAGTGERGVPTGIQCQQAGIGTLQGLGLLPAVARNGIEVVELGRVVPFREVLSLHRSSPELFQSGTGVTVVVPGLGNVAATWCDGIG